jgi:hypothetical protein
MDTSVFEQIASSLTVSSICGSLGPDIAAGTAIEDLFSDPDFERWDSPSRVIDSDGHVVGMLSFNDVMAWSATSDDAFMVDQIMENIEPHRFLSRDTTILDVVDLFSTRSETHYYVIHTNRIVGTLWFNDLFKPLGRLAFLALALEIEDQALRLCQSKSNRDACWRSLAEGRKTKAIELFKRRYACDPKVEGDPKPLERPDILRLIECTQLVDKATMIWKQKLISPTTGADVLGVFNKLRIVRDQCAHPGRDGPPNELSNNEAFARFINSAKAILASLRDSMQAHGIDSTEFPGESFVLGDDVGERSAESTEALARLKAITEAPSTAPSPAPPPIPPEPANPVPRKKPVETNYAGALRKELIDRAEHYAGQESIQAHVYRSRGTPPTVLFKQYTLEGMSRCDNFTPAAYQEILDCPNWKDRLSKAHSKKDTAFDDADIASAKELDSCCSSDALLMNIVCHPSSRANQKLWELFGCNQIPDLDFGFKANLPFGDGTIEPRSSEIDLRLSNSTGDLTIFVEAKLTEPNFTAKEISKVEKYCCFASVFFKDRLPACAGKYHHYQLLRNVIAANYYQAGFRLVCDERRLDLQEAWAEVGKAMMSTDLKERCRLITWQQVAALLPPELQTFLAGKYGIVWQIH